MALPLAGGHRGRRALPERGQVQFEESDRVWRVNLSWKATDTSMLYATWSEGYRPGGINRNPFVGDYVSDFLTNYELGWKSRFADDRFQFNGAVFLEEWDDIQVSFQGANGITQVDNGPQAEVQGIEAQLDWLATDNLRIGTSLAYYDSELKDDYCDLDAAGTCVNVNAPAGTPLPVTPDFKGNLIARYTFPMGGFDAHVQGAYVYQTSRASILNVADNEIYGDIPSSNFLDLAFGVENDKYAIELYVSNVTDEDAPLYVTSRMCSGGLWQPVLWRAEPAADDRHPVLAGLLKQDRLSTARGAARRPFSFRAA